MSPFDPRTLIARRAFLRKSGTGLGAAMLGSLLHGRDEAGLAPDFEPRAKSIIYLHMIGAPSQLDLFDPKPELKKWDGKLCPDSFIEGKRFAFIRGHPTLAASPYEFRRHGASGATISDRLPHLAQVADELCFIRSMQTEEFNHAPAQLFMHTGHGIAGRPSIGSWLDYGLGSENRALPSYVVMLSGKAGGAGSALWSSGFLPSIHQGTPFRSEGEPVLFLTNPEHTSRGDRRRVLDSIRDLNALQFSQAGDPEIETRIGQYEMAFRMQSSVPDLTDIASEDPKTLEMYGAEPGRASFANNCLMARRLVERGVRVVELYDADWDHHGDLDRRLTGKCRDVDQGMAALIADLKQRGLLDSTLIVWGGEFGRTPMAQDVGGNGEKHEPGRDHHKDAFTVWLAGGGIKGGVSHGKTDEFGYSVVENPVHVHDLNATLLHQLGLDHERLTYRYQGRDFRLTDVHGHVVRDILA